MEGGGGQSSGPETPPFPWIDFGPSPRDAPEQNRAASISRKPLLRGRAGSPASRCAPRVADPLSKMAQTWEGCLPPLDRKPGLDYEARRRAEALPGASELSTASLPCVS